MIENSQQNYAKIDAIISGLRMINLHFYNSICELLSNKPREAVEKEALIKRLKKLNVAHYQEHLKFISQYLKKCIKDMSKTKIILSPLIYRSIRSKVEDEDFLRFQNLNYGVKFTFMDVYKECVMNIEIYRKLNGYRITGLSINKLEITFLHDLAERYPESNYTIDILENEGKNILEQATNIFSGEKCQTCSKNLCFNEQYMVFLVPTIREVHEINQNKRQKKYYHQGCL